MNETRLKNFRCFRDEQRARLAPLTLLVGENSTGKTSFMAMIRILSDIAYRLHGTQTSKKTPTISGASMRLLIIGVPGVAGLTNSKQGFRVKSRRKKEPLEQI